MLLRETAAARPADLHGLEFLPVLDAAADIENDLAQRRSHRHLDETGVADVSRKRKGLGAGGGRVADGAVSVGALVDDIGDVGKGLHIVEHGGLCPETLFHGARGLGARHTAVALNGRGQRAALAADERARAAVDADIKGKFRAEDVLTEQTDVACLINGLLQAINRERILRADVDITAAGTARDRGDHRRCRRYT